MQKYIVFSVTVLIQLSCSLLSNAQGPQVMLLTEGTKTSLRGLSVVNDNVLWASGSNGKVGKSSNAGKNWEWMTVKGFEKREFRDIEAFDASTAIIIAIDTPAYILKTIDGGKSWKTVYENHTPGMFLDAMDFASLKKGIVVGDPVNGCFFLAKTEDGGDSWTEIRCNEQVARPDSGEAFFASSGGNIKFFINEEYYAASGGLQSRLITSKGATELPIRQNKETTGANAIDIFDEGVPLKPGKRMIIVGGNFMADSVKTKNCFYSSNGGKSWKQPAIPPSGYRSSVEYLTKKYIICSGLNGVDLSRDGGRRWTKISDTGFHVVRIARTGSAVYFAGGNGRLGKLVW